MFLKCTQYAVWIVTQNTKSDVRALPEKCQVQCVLSSAPFKFEFTYQPVTNSNQN